MTRPAITHKAKVGGTKFYITVGMFEDGRAAEIFVKCDKSEFNGWTNSLGILISIALQSGVPIEVIVGKLERQRFEPSGPTGNKQIPFASSIVDYLAQFLGYKFINGYRKDAYAGGGT